MKKFLHKNNGYTIIETMVAVSLFVVITMTGMSTLLNANAIYQKSQNMRSIMDNLSFIMEEISRNLRTGYDYRCYNASQSLGGDLANINIPRSCANGWAVAFEASPGGNPGDDTDQWVYMIDGDGQIYKSTNNATGGISNFVKLTPDDIDIDLVSSFAVLGAEGTPGNTQQPLVVIRLVGTITYKNTTTPFSLQTSVSQRLIDV